MFCSSCGKELDDGQKFCPSCGKKFEEVPVEENTNPIQDAPSSHQSSSGFVLGLVSIVAWLLPLAGYPVTICGIVFSSKQLKTATDSSSKTRATVGLLLSIIFLILTLINSALGVIMNFSLNY